ncbi:hypothetical protein NW765_005972 [Fusarium oxysporum]|nr:hypothetical protein NW765_005972 [Fusarium oxysporum]
MDSATLETVRTVVPLLPLIVRQGLAHILNLSDSSKYLDLRSAIIIACLRVVLTPKAPRSISSVQRLTLRDSGIKGHIWVSKYATPQPPETSIRDALISTLEQLGGSTCRVPVPDLVDVEAEWTGYRSGVARGAPLPDVSERERYHGMMQECKKPTTVLYLHGGAYYLCDPATHRPTTKKLAQLTGVGVTRCAIDLRRNIHSLRRCLTLLCLTSRFCIHLRMLIMTLCNRSIL